MKTEKQIGAIREMADSVITPKILLQNGERLIITVKRGLQEVVLTDVAASSQPSKENDMLDFLVSINITPCVRNL